MLDILRLYLVEAATPEFLDVMTDAHAFFERAQLPYFEDEYVSILQQADSMDLGEVNTQISNQTILIQNQLLKERGIVLTEEATIDFRTQILNGLMNLDEFENTQEMLDILNSDVNEIEKFAELIATATTLEEEELMILTENVGPNFVAVTRDMIQSRNDNVIDEDEIVFKAARASLFNRFKAFTGDNELVMGELFDKGIDVGFPFSTYVDVVDRDYEAMAPDVAARNLIAMALCSSDGADNPQSIIKSRIDSLIADPARVTKIDIKITDLLLGFNQYDE